MKTSDRGIALIKEFEGCKLKAYKCPAGKWTIGFGATGQAIVEGLVWSQEQADAALLKHIAEFEQAVSDQITVPLTQGQFDALVSFTYNLGARRLRNSTLRRLLNKGDYSGAAKQFALWISKGTPYEAGLRRRREAERQLFAGA
jgi:lysozyme